MNVEESGLWSILNLGKRLDLKKLIMNNELKKENGKENG